MRIHLFIDNLGAGGAQRQLVGLAVMLQENGHDIKVCTYYPQDFYKSYLDENGVFNEIIPNAENAKTRIWAVRNYFKKERPDCVIAYQETPSMVACAAKVLGCRYKLVVSERNTTQVAGIKEKVRFFFYKYADAIVPNSYAQERWLKDHYLGLESKIKTITNFVDLDKFHPNEHTRKSIPEFVVAASIWESKNTLGLISALSLLKTKGIKCHFSWYGKSESNIDYFNKCISLIKEKNLEEYIDLLPKTKDIQLKYQEADFFCLPSFYEGTPNVLCEAISSGLPVMVSNVCDNSLYAINGKNAFLFNPNSEEEIAQSIEKLLSLSDDEYYKFREKSRCIALELLAKDLFLGKYLQLLDKIYG